LPEDEKRLSMGEEVGTRGANKKREKKKKKKKKVRV
jgi:hypothetical protein